MEYIFLQKSSPSYAVFSNITVKTLTERKEISFVLVFMTSQGRSSQGLSRLYLTRPHVIRTGLRGGVWVSR